MKFQRRLSGFNIQLILISVERHGNTELESILQSVKAIQTRFLILEKQRCDILKATHLDSDRIWTTNHVS